MDHAVSVLGVSIEAEEHLKSFASAPARRGLVTAHAGPGFPVQPPGDCGRDDEPTFVVGES